MTNYTVENLPGLDCGLCGYRTCADLADVLPTSPDLIKRCTMLSAGESMRRKQNVSAAPTISVAEETPCGACAIGGVNPFELSGSKPVWLDSLGREFDFFLEHFPEELGPREIILPHNPLITRDMDIQPGDIMLGRPLGMSCGCPITHCGVCMSADHRTGVIVWCVTGPLQTRQGNFKDLGYYIAEGYEGLIKDARCEIKIGMRYYFQPRMCMLQWRHSGLVNYLSRTDQGMQVRVEGLWIG